MVQCFCAHIITHINDSLEPTRSGKLLSRENGTKGPILTQCRKLSSKLMKYHGPIPFRPLFVTVFRRNCLLIKIRGLKSRLTKPKMDALRRTKKD